MSNDRKHHPRSPSKLQYLEACDCYRSREDVAHERAIAGTMAHAVADTQEDNQKLSDDDAVAVAECLDFAETRRKEMEGAALAAWESDCRLARELGNPLPSRINYHVTEIKEEYLPIDDCKYEDAESTTAGYADHCFVSSDKSYAEIIDWKFGNWPVEKAENNLQGISYALGLFKRIPELLTVRVWFKQPHLSYVTDATFTRHQIPRLYLRVKTVVERAYAAEKRKGDNPDRPEVGFSTAKPHTPCCLFCADIGRCPKVASFALQVAKKYHPLRFPDSLTLHQVTSPEQTALMLELVGVLKVYSDQARRVFTERVLSGDAPVPAGYEIHTKSGARKIIDMEKLHASALHYLTEQEYASCLDASFGTLEDKISEKAPRGIKEKTVQAFRSVLEETGAVAKGAKFSFLRQTTGEE